MRTITLSALAASLALVFPASAEESHHPAQPGATPGAVQPDGRIMQKMQESMGMPPGGPAKPAK